MNFAPQNFQYVSTIGGWLWHNPIREEGDDSVHVPPTLVDRVFVVLWARMACYLIACILLVTLACKIHCRTIIIDNDIVIDTCIASSAPGKDLWGALGQEGMWSDCVPPSCRTGMQSSSVSSVDIVNGLCQWHCSGLRSKQGPVKVEGLPDHSWPVIDNAIEGVLFGSYYHSSCAVRYFKLVKVGSCHEDLAVALLL